MNVWLEKNANFWILSGYTRMKSDILNLIQATK